MKNNTVVTNIAQDFSKTEKAQGRANIDAQEIKGYVECYRRFNDGSSADTWFKICDLEPGTSSSYSYGYELSLKFVCTNNGGGDCPAESATLNMGCNFIPAVNVARCEVAWADHTASNHATCTITGVKVLTRRASDNYGPRDKMELWVKTSQYFTYYTQMRVEAIINSGNYCYRGTYSTPSLYVLPFNFRNSLVTGTHTDPFNYSEHPAAESYGAAGWSEVWYPCETKTVMVDHAQNFTDTEKEQARENIGATDGKDVSWVSYNEGQPTPLVQKSGLSVVNSGTRVVIQNDDGSKKYVVGPDYASGDVGKVLGIRSGGSVAWVDVPQPNPSVEMQTWLTDMNNSGACTKMFKQCVLPMKNGKYPSRVTGSMTVSPDIGTQVSICPLAQYWPNEVWDEEQQDWIPNPNAPVFTQASQCHNFHHVLNGTDVSGNHNFYTQYSFNFYATEVSGMGNLQCICVKGLSDEDSLKTENITMTCFWDEGVE